MAVAVVAAVAAAACSNGPSSPSGSSGTTGSVTAPRPAQPSANASLRFGDQPVTLMVNNAVVTKTGPTYTFEVATDPAFSAKTQTKDNIAEGANGQTTVTLDALAAGKDYYWHARVTAGGTAGPFSATSKFTIGPAVVLGAPVPIGPLSGSTTAPRPALRVLNAVRSGPAGAITYLFEIANSSAFTTVIVSSTKSEGVNETGFIPITDLPVNATLFWRATAIDSGTGLSSLPSAVQSFTVRPLSQAEAIALQLGVPLWSGTTPPGNTGHATMGNDPVFGVGWQIQTLHYYPGNVDFQSPDIEMLRFFDLFDRGFDPDGAAAWLNANGYPTNALWYPPPEKAVLGLRYVYIAARGKVSTNGIWDVVLRIE